MAPAPQSGAGGRSGSAAHAWLHSHPSSDPLVEAKAKHTHSAISGSSALLEEVASMLRQTLLGKIGDYRKALESFDDFPRLKELLSCFHEALPCYVATGSIST